MLNMSNCAQWQVKLMALILFIYLYYYIYIYYYIILYYIILYYIYLILLAIRKIQMPRYNHAYLKQQQKNLANYERKLPVNPMF